MMLWRIYQGQIMVLEMSERGCENCGGLDMWNVCVRMLLCVCVFDYSTGKAESLMGVGLTLAHSLTTYLITGTSNFLSLNKEEIG